MPGGQIDIEKLVQGFRQHLKVLKSPATNEAQVRQSYIDPFWRALGWDVGDRKQLGPTLAEVIIEKTVETAESTGLRNRFPDYLFRLNGFTRFVVEAKKPAIDIDQDRQAIFQAKQYAWNSTIPFAILTDFEQFRLYDTTLKPIFTDPRRGLVPEFELNFDDYLPQWDVMLRTFHRDAVAEGSLEQLLSSIKKVKPGRRIRTVDRLLIDLKGSEPVDKIFLAYLDAHRKHFAAGIYRHNKSSFPDAHTLHGAARLTEAVQRIMDRLVFMRVIEDRDIAPYGELRDTLQRVGDEGGEFYEVLCATFRDYDQKYNGYLFKPHFSETLVVDGGVLADFVRTLYPPDESWDFAAIGDDILGIVYERFLGNVVTVKQSQAVIEEKPEVRHAGGVYYTPRFVVDTIIRRVIGPKLEGKAPAEVLDVKILDPACGSGSFLVAALQYLFDYCLGAVAANPELAKSHIPAWTGAPGKRGRKKKSEIAFQDKDGEWHLAPDFRAALLTHCIHGVDIDLQAVEVTVMSLYLKMLESKLPENWATLWVEKQLLPALENNIRCGNSLIDPKDYDDYLVYTKRSLFGEDKETAFRINRFDWQSETRGFGRVIGTSGNFRGFDCIIGNPPYIRVQELKKWASEECEFYKWRYKSAAKGNYDIYVVFTEKALTLLASDGLLGFIMPHKFWQAQYGAGLRKLIADGNWLRAIIDFRQEQVFRGATTYTAIHILGPGNVRDSKVDYTAVLQLQDGAAQLGAVDSLATVPGVERISAEQPNPGAWSFVASSRRILSQIDPVNVAPLSAVARLAQGIKTSADKVFVLSIDRWSDDRAIVTSPQTGKKYEIERAVLWPLIKSEQMKRFRINSPTRALLFPYERESGHFELISVERWQNEYPCAWTYLTEVRPVLEARERGRMKGRADWFAYIYPKNFNAMTCPKLVIPDISEHMQVGIDSQGEYIFSGGGAGGNAIIPADPEQMHFLCGVLNSRLIETCLRQEGTAFRGGYLNCEIRFIRNLPIKTLTTASEKELGKHIALCVSAIVEAKSELQNLHISENQRRSLESTLEANENRIDDAIFKLYGVTGVSD